MQILDCTLRDGGYYTQWDFPGELVQQYFTHLENLPVHIIEFGYRSIKQQAYAGRFFYSPPELLQQVKQWAPSKQLAIMLDEKDSDPADLDRLLDPCKGYVDIIRIAVAPERLEKAIVLCREIKKKGFKAGLNIMYMSTLAENPAFFRQLSALEGVADSLSMVDSYGGVFPYQVKQIIAACRQYTTVPLGFHGHNNMELAFANSLAAIEAGCDIIDATVTGMGRGAGNLKTELLLTHLATKEKWEVDFDALGSMADAFEQLRQQYHWGTNLPYMVSGASSLPQKDVMDWVSKRYYSVNSIVRALQNQQKGEIDNLKLPVFKPEKKYDTALVVAGGPSVKEHAPAIVAFARSLPNACIIHVSSKNAAIFQEVPNDQFFCLVGNEGHRMEAAFGSLSNIKGQCILPPYPRRMGTYIPPAVKDHSFELEAVTFSHKYTDAHTALAMQAAINLGVTTVWLFGYDGYTGQQLSEKEQDLADENNYLLTHAAPYFKKFAALTATRYNVAEQLSVYQFII
jgi:4-hydroxy 2-oxovalerate aldolase